MKPQRWYNRPTADTVHIYNHPNPQHATAVSMVKPADLKYYRQNFTLQRADEPTN